MKTPGPDHPIRIEPVTGRVVVRYQGVVVADSRDALKLTEASYPPVLYIPRADALLEYYAHTDHHTHCPYKGDASYYTLSAAGKDAANAVWSYEEPYPAVEQIRNHLAFYVSQVAIENVEA